jgi:geranylgeranyl reductase family protein
VGDERFDVLVVGAGPAGSVAALTLARGGARVALVDKAEFPRDKACGDLVGPRGVQLLDDLGIGLADPFRVGDMMVVGPTGGRVRLHCFPGLTYPSHAYAVPRTEFDGLLRDAALAAGAIPFVGQVVRPVEGDHTLDGCELADGRRIRADVVIGADGATSRVAEMAGMVDRQRVMWGFAVRSYLDQPVDLPYIVLWETARWRGLPGYGWLFPGPDGRANVGLGVGALADRTAATQAVRLLPAFLDDLRHGGLIEKGGAVSGRPLGGWLKMGIVGTTPADGRVLLVGDAAGLVNPLQGEGISQAMGSAFAAATAVLDGPDQAATRYRRVLGAVHAEYHRIAAATQAALLPHPTAIAAVGRLLTLPLLGDALAGGWSIFWNELLDGAGPSRARTTARAATLVGRAVTRPTTTRRWFEQTFSEPHPMTVGR